MQRLSFGKAANGVMVLLLCAIAVTLSLCSSTIKAYADTPDEVVICGHDVPSGYYLGADGATVIKADAEPEGESSYAYYSEGMLTIKNITYDWAVLDADCYGIYVDGSISVIVKGEGNSLAANGGGENAYGLYATGDVFFDEKSTGRIDFMAGGTSDKPVSCAYGIWANTLTVKGGVVRAMPHDASGQCVSVHANNAQDGLMLLGGELITGVEKSPAATNIGVEAATVTMEAGSLDSFFDDTYSPDTCYGMKVSGEVRVNDGKFSMATPAGSTTGIALDAASAVLNGGRIHLQGSTKAISVVPDTEGYEGVVFAASTKYDGSGPVPYNKADIASYKFLSTTAGNVTLPEEVIYDFGTEATVTADVSNREDKEPNNYTYDWSVLDNSGAWKEAKGNWTGPTIAFPILDYTTTNYKVRCVATHKQTLISYESNECTLLMNDEEDIPDAWMYVEHQLLMPGGTATCKNGGTVTLSADAHTITLDNVQAVLGYSSGTVVSPLGDSTVLLYRNLDASDDTVTNVVLRGENSVLLDSRSREADEGTGGVPFEIQHFQHVEGHPNYIPAATLNVTAEGTGSLLVGGAEGCFDTYAGLRAMGARMNIVGNVTLKGQRVYNAYTSGSLQATGTTVCGTVYGNVLSALGDASSPGHAGFMQLNGVDIDVAAKDCSGSNALLLAQGNLEVFDSQVKLSSNLNFNHINQGVETAPADSKLIHAGAAQGEGGLKVTNSTLDLTMTAPGDSAIVGTTIVNAITSSGDTLFKGSTVNVAMSSQKYAVGWSGMNLLTLGNNPDAPSSASVESSIINVAIDAMGISDENRGGGREGITTDVGMSVTEDSKISISIASKDDPGMAALSVGGDLQVKDATVDAVVTGDTRVGVVEAKSLDWNHVSYQDANAVKTPAHGIFVKDKIKVELSDASYHVTGTTDAGIGMSAVIDNKLQEPEPWDPNYVTDRLILGGKAQVLTPTDVVSNIYCYQTGVDDDNSPIYMKADAVFSDADHSVPAANATIGVEVQPQPKPDPKPDPKNPTAPVRTGDTLLPLCLAIAAVVVVALVVLGVSMKKRNKR